MSKLEIDSVREEISRLFPTGNPTLGAVARALRVSPRTLQRQLAEAGFTFQALVGEVRLVNAIRLISEHYKLSDIAFRLGYADASSFTRAFERWTGLTPQKYRRRFGRIADAANHRAKY